MMKVLQFTIPVSKDQTIIAQRDEMPYFYPHLHRHKEIQIRWIISGEGTLVVNNNMHTFSDNDVFFIGANQPHIFKSSPSYFLPDSEKKVSSIDVFFDPVTISETLLKITELKTLRAFLQKSGNGFKVPEKHIANITNKLLQIKEGKSAIPRVLHFIEMLHEMKKIDNPMVLSKESSFTVNESEGMRISQVYNFILQNYARDISLDEVAKQIFMTPQAFCRFFKKHTRLSFVTFLNEIRVNEVCQLIAEGNNDNISSIAYGCGFNSITNFNRVFKGITGYSPRQYVENLQSKT